MAYNITCWFVTGIAQAESGVKWHLHILDRKVWALRMFFR